MSRAAASPLEIRFSKPVSPPKCALCSGPADMLMRVRKYPIVRCRNCGHHFLGMDLSHEHAASTYGDSYFRGGVDGYADYCAEGAELVDRGRMYGELLKEFSPAGSVFDVGAAAGFLLKGLTQAGWHGVGVEPNASMVDYARHNNEVDVRLGTFEQWKRREPFHAVTMIQVISHFYDLRKAMEVTQSITAPGSYWLVETWDRESHSARAAGVNWHEFNPPSVVQWFSREGLEYLGEQYGFEAIAQGRPNKRISVGNARAILAQNDSMWSRAACGALRLLPTRLSLRYPGDDVFWMLFRRR